MYKIIVAMSLFVSSLSTAGCSWLLDLEGVTLADGGVDSEPADSGVDSEPSPHNYQCGYAMPGFHCDNGRSHVALVAPDLTSGIAKCRMAMPMPSLEFCYVMDLSGDAPIDATECTAASGSWRPGSHCCNFEGTVSCP